MATLTYDDFLKKVNSAGLMSQFSDYDLALAKQNPTAGLSILNDKISYNNATTDEARALANASANRTRQAYGEYSGGTDGAVYSSTRVSPGAFQSDYADDIKTLYGDYKGMNFGDWKNSEEYNQMRDLYVENGQKAMDDAVGTLSGRTGGIASSYAGTVGASAYNKYMQDLNSAALSRYDNAVNRKYDTLSLARSLDLDAYGRNQDELAYQLDRLNTEKSDERYADETAYSRQQDALDRAYQQQVFDYQAQQDALDRAYNTALFTYQKEQDALDRSAAAAQTTADLDYTALIKLLMEQGMTYDEAVKTVLGG